MRINVTQEDIDNGRKVSCNWCPIACALRKVFPNKLISIWGGIRVGQNIFKLSRKTRKFIQDFDKYGRHKVKPFYFYINI